MTTPVSRIWFIGTFLVLSFFAGRHCHAQEAGNRDEVRRLLNEAFDIWLESEETEDDGVILQEEMLRFARMGLAGEATRNIEKVLEKKPSVDCRRAAETLIGELLDRKERDLAVQLIETFDGRVDRKREAIPSWRDTMFQKVIKHDVSDNQVERALDVLSMMQDGESGNGDEQKSPTPYVRSCLLIIAEHYIRDGKPQRSLEFLKERKLSVSNDDRERLINQAINNGELDWATEQVGQIPVRDREYIAYRVFDTAILSQEWNLARRLADDCATYEPKEAAEWYALLAFAMDDDQKTQELHAEAIHVCNPLPEEAYSVFVANEIKQGRFDEAIERLAADFDTYDDLDSILLSFIVWAVREQDGDEGRLAAISTLARIRPSWLRTRVKLELAREQSDADDRAWASELVGEIASEWEAIPGEQLHEFPISEVARLFAEFGFLEHAEQALTQAAGMWNDMAVLAIRFWVAEILLEKGRRSEAMSLLDSVEPNTALPAGGFEFGARLVMQDDVKTAIQVMQLTNPDNLHLVARAVQKLVQDGNSKNAQDLWSATLKELPNEDLQSLIRTVEGIVFGEEDAGHHLVEEITGYESVFTGTPEILMPVLMAYGRLGMTRHVIRLVEANKGHWSSEELLPVVKMLVEVGQYSFLVQLVSEQSGKSLQPLLKEHEFEFRALHALLAGQTDKAVKLADSIKESGTRRQMLIRCARQLNSPWLVHLRRIDNWLESVAVQSNGYVRYPVAIETRDRFATNLYSGLPGVLMFYGQMYETTTDELYRMRFRRIARSIVYDINQLSAENAGDPGLFTGYSGAGFVLRESYDWKVLPAVRKCVELLLKTAVEAQDASGRRTARWNETTDVISGSAGIGRFLLEARYGGNRYNAITNLAVAVGDQLLECAERVELSDGRSGLRWQMRPDYAREMPNYSHGTAGICDFLLELDVACSVDSETYAYAEPGMDYDGRFHKAAIAGARYLESLNRKYGSKGLLPHHLPDGEQLFYLGWCHGPPGTCRLFDKLRYFSDDKAFSGFSEAAAEQVLKLALYENRTDGFWNNVGLCCGSAGVGAFLFEQARRQEDPRLEEEAKRIAADIIRRGTVGETEDGRPTLCWQSAEHRVRPDFLQTQTGLMQGAAGVGIFLLQLEMASQSEYPYGIADEIFP